MDIPQDLPVVERSAVRLVVLDADDRVLLFRIEEPQHPEQGTVWELPGGGIDTHESHRDAAIRELREETGFALMPEDIEARPTWRRHCTFRHAGVRRVQDEVVVCARLHEHAPHVEAGNQLRDELETYRGFRWWRVADIETSTQRFFPGRLPALIRRFLDGEQIEEPFEYFS
jgi:8-oxo-dGTP pyrophosphatase MutT (NUDIX family)